MHRPAGGRTVEPAHELTVLGGDAVLVAVLHRGLEALRERLRSRAVMQVLEPLLGGRPDPLLLLSDVRHSREKARSSRAAAWYQRVPSLYSRAWTSAPAAGSRGRRRSSRSPPASPGFSASSARLWPPTTSARRGRSTPSRSPSRSRTSSARSSRTPPCRRRSSPSSPSCRKRATASAP